MISKSVQLNTNGTGRVIVDGHDISGSVASVSLSAEPMKGTTATLTLRGVCLSRMEPDRLELDHASRMALVALGWTPPAADSGVRQRVVSSKPNATGIMVDAVPGHEFVLSDSTAVLVLAGESAAKDYRAIVNQIAAALGGVGD